MKTRIRRAATVIPVRDGHVYLVERNPTLRFFPGYWAFPGGTLDEADEARSADDLAPFRSAALRELDEETGLKLDDSQLVPCGRLLTPAFAPVQYDTQFFLAEIPEGAEPVIEQGELVDGRWFKPAEALAAFRRGDLKVPPPTLAMLRLLRTHTPREAAAQAHASDGRPHHERFRIEMHPGVYVLPLETTTLPPATTTNCYILGSDRMVVIDPGPLDTVALEPLKYLLQELLEEGRRFVGVLLTHHHPDHIGGARWVADFVGAPVLASVMTHHHLPELVDAVIKDGDLLDLGFDTETEQPWRLEVTTTPGHTHGHLSFRDTRFGAIFTGDMMSGVSTIVIDPPEGDMALYFRSLARLADLRAPILLPAHGPPFMDPGKAIADLVAHRLARETKVVEALAKHPEGADARSLVPFAYDDTPESLWSLAERSLFAHLLKLAAESRATRRDDLWFPAA